MSGGYLVSLAGHAQPERVRRGVLFPGGRDDVHAVRARLLVLPGFLGVLPIHKHDFTAAATTPSAAPNSTCTGPRESSGSVSCPRR